MVVAAVKTKKSQMIGISQALLLDALVVRHLWFHHAAFAVVVVQQRLASPYLTALRDRCCVGGHLLVLLLVDAAAVARHILLVSFLLLQIHLGAIVAAAVVLHSWSI